MSNNDIKGYVEKKIDMWTLDSTSYTLYICGTLKLGFLSLFQLLS